MSQVISKLDLDTGIGNWRNCLLITGMVKQIGPLLTIIAYYKTFKPQFDHCAYGMKC